MPLGQPRSAYPGIGKRFGEKARTLEKLETTLIWTDRGLTAVQFAIGAGVVIATVKEGGKRALIKICASAVAGYVVEQLTETAARRTGVSERTIGGIKLAIAIVSYIILKRRIARAKAPRVTESPYQVHVDPKSGRGPMAVDTSGFAGEATLKGGVRNPKSFWHEWSKGYGDTLSDANKAAIKAGRSPVVDDKWIQHFPEHAPYKGETLIHHHLDYGPKAIPLPDSVHSKQPGWGIWHPEHAGGQ